MHFEETSTVAADHFAAKRSPKHCKSTYLGLWIYEADVAAPQGTDVMVNGQESIHSGNS